MERHAANALEVARFLEQHPKVARVQYPGLPSHPQHNLAARQMSSGGGIVSFFVEGSPDGTTKVLERIRYFALAESLGGVESLIAPSLDDEPRVGSRDIAARGRNYTATCPTFYGD